MRVVLPSQIQRKLIDAYKEKNILTWKEMADRFGVGESTLRYFFRWSLKTLPENVFNELAEGKKIKGAVYLHKNFRPKICHGRNSFRSVKTMKRRFGVDFFAEIGKKGAIGRNEKYEWTKERRYKHSICGSMGGLKRTEGMRFLTKQEKRIVASNESLSIDFKSNHSIDKMNFDFVYFKNGKIFAAEEVTENAMRGLSFILEKRKFLDRRFSTSFPFLLTCGNSKPDIMPMLLKCNIIPLYEEDRRGLIKEVLSGRRDVRETLIKNYVRSRLKARKNNVNVGAKSECSKLTDFYEILVHKSLAVFKPHGKKIFEAPYGSCFVPDDYFEVGKEKIAVLTSCCNSRGSLFYTFYNHSSQAEAYRKLFGLKTLSIIFDKSKSSASFTENIPRRLWEKSCDYKIMITDDPSIKLLSVKIEQSLCDGRVA